jgi:hypothetical protein
MIFVIIAVVADFVSAGDDLKENLGIVFNPHPSHEKSAFDIVLVEYIQNL